MSFIISNRLDSDLDNVFGKDNWFCYCFNINNNISSFEHRFRLLGLSYNIFNSEPINNYKTFDKNNHYKSSYINLLRYILETHPDKQYFFILEDTSYLSQDTKDFSELLIKGKNLFTKNQCDILWLSFNNDDKRMMIDNNVCQLLNSSVTTTMIYNRQTIQHILYRTTQTENKDSSIEQLLNSNYKKICSIKPMFSNFKDIDFYINYDSFFDYTKLLKNYTRIDNLQYNFKYDSMVQKFFIPYNLLLEFLNTKMYDKFICPIILMTESDNIDSLCSYTLENIEKVLKIIVLTNGKYVDNSKIMIVPKSIKLESSYIDFSSLLVNVKNCKRLSTTFTDSGFSRDVIDRCFVVCNNYNDWWLSLYFNRIPLLTFRPENNLYNYVPHIQLEDTSETLDKLYETFIYKLQRNEYNLELLKLNYWTRKTLIHNYKKIDKTLLVAVMTKNVIKHISGVLNNINTYTSLFKDYKVCIVDGYSDDGTSEYCKKWCSIEPKKRTVLSQINKKLSRPLGLEEARNMYITYFEKDFNKETYLLCIDGDEVNSQDVDIDGFMSNFNYSDWDAMFCNNTQSYYDIWALRKEDCNYDCWEMVRATGDNSYVDRHFKKIPREEPIIPVTSAFGGAGIYLTEKLKGIRYASFQNDKEICEHVPFNTQLVDRGAKLYINPNFISM